MKNNQTNQPDDNYIDSEKDLILVNKELESHEDFYKMALQFQQIMMVYESAIKQVETKLEILNKEYKVFGRRNPIETIKSRIKTPESIATKLQKKGVPVTFKSMSENLTDIAGVRVICPYISDIYTIKDVLLKQPDLKLLEERGTELRLPYSEHLDDGIFELRTKQGTNIIRNLYFFFVENKIIVTHGFRKKTQKTPSGEIERAKEYRKDYLAKNPQKEEKK